MIAVRLIGGLGNQMFQYAIAKRIAEYHRIPLKLDLSVLLDRTQVHSHTGFAFRDYDYALDTFTLSADFLNTPETLQKIYRSPFIGKRWRKIISLVYGRIKEPKNNVYLADSALIENPPKRGLLCGYWQNESYFSDITQILKQDFRMAKPLLPVSKDLFSQIQNSHSVCVHIRRGDYVRSPYHNLASQSYFKRGLKIIANRVTGLHVFVFSDDLEWCLKHVRFHCPVTFVGYEHSGDKNSNCFRLMRSCKHFVIANSTFSWWAAWLGNAPNKIVIAPKQWVNDPSIDTSQIIPERWIRI